MKRILIFVLCISILFIFTGCDGTKETKILDFKESDVETVELYRFNTPAEAQGMIVTEGQDIQKIINAFSKIRIEGDATDFNIFGGEVTSFRFNLKSGKEFAVVYWEGILRNLDSIDYKVSGEPIANLWDDLDYQKDDVGENKLPIINK